MKDLPISIKKFIENNPIVGQRIRGLPDLGKNRVTHEFSNEVKKIGDVFGIYGNELYQLENDKIRGIPSRSLGGGSPMKTGPFPMCKEEMIKFISSDGMSDYPLAAGDENYREIILEYLKNEGFDRDEELTIDNIIFTVSTTQAFNIICDAIARPYDVILMTGPNYGLFTFVPERSVGATVEILPLSEEDDWYVNPQKLANRIDEINQQLQIKYGDSLGYKPRVVAFLNENPHNPLGKVMNEGNKKILEGIGDVCLDRGVFVIDDLIYRDLTYDRENLAKPMGSYKKYFDNTITITGLSKSYGLAAIRSGMVVAHESVIRSIRNTIFQTMDSSPVIQASAMAGAFNTFPNRQKEYDAYFNPIIAEYKYRLELLKALINGLDTIEHKDIRAQIEKDINQFGLDYEISKLCDGIPGVDFVKGTIPESGFFELLDFTALKGKTGENGRTISSEIELLKYMYEEKKIKLILGQSISWPNGGQLVGRVTTALSRRDLVEHFGAMNQCLRKVK